MKKLKTYIGICDFMSPQQVFAMLKVFNCYKDFDLQLMIGTMTSYKVINNLETKWSSIFPKPESLKYIFSALGDNFVNCIHYADYENKPGLADTLKTVYDYCGRNQLDAIQLDMVWPNPDELNKFQKLYPTQFVLQINKQSMNLCNDNPVSVAEKIRKEYSGIISHVLLDCSMGKGVKIDTAFIEGYIEAIKSRAPEVQIAVAGGLGPDTVDLVKDLISKYRVSIDAQSKLRISGRAEDPIDWNLAEKYLHNAVSLYI